MAKRVIIEGRSGGDVAVGLGDGDLLHYGGLRYAWWDIAKHLGQPKGGPPAERDATMDELAGMVALRERLDAALEDNVRLKSKIVVATRDQENAEETLERTVVDLEAMQPIVDAAVAWRPVALSIDELVGAGMDLCDAVDAYARRQAGEPEPAPEPETFAVGDRVRVTDASTWRGPGSIIAVMGGGAVLRVLRDNDGRSRGGDQGGFAPCELRRLPREKGGA